MRRVLNTVGGGVLGAITSVLLFQWAKVSVWGWVAGVVVILAALVGIWWLDRREKYWRQKAWEAAEAERKRDEA